MSLIKVVFIKIQLIFDLHDDFENEKFVMFDDFLDKFGRLNKKVSVSFFINDQYCK